MTAFVPLQLKVESDSPVSVQSKLFSHQKSVVLDFKQREHKPKRGQFSA